MCLHSLRSPKGLKNDCYSAAHCSFMCRAAERRDVVGGKHNEVHKRVSNVFQKHLTPTVALEVMSPALCQCVSAELGNHPADEHGDCIVPLQWQRLTHTHTNLTNVCPHIDKNRKNVKVPIHISWKTLPMCNV